MNICDALDTWDDRGQGYGDRLQAVRDWVKAEAEEWGMDPPSVVVGKSVDAEGKEHWASYNAETDTITMDPELFRQPDIHDASDVFNSAAHELRHAMQDQYDEQDEDDSEEDMGKDDREQDADDFADAYEALWDSECGDPESESAPGEGLGDWNLPAESVENDLSEIPA
jgi:hypothetical protein